MDFCEAIYKMGCKEKVRRKSNPEIIFYLHKDYPHDYDFFTEDDKLANDWEIIKRGDF